MQFPAELLQQCWFLAGPTAVGKTAVGIALAERIDAEIVCLDSMTLYRGMDIGTAKPTKEERARRPHHLLDVLAPHQEYSVADYLAAAETVCRDVLNRGRIPLFVGGTGLYLRSLLRGVFQDRRPTGRFDGAGKPESNSTEKVGCTTVWRRSTRPPHAGCTRRCPPGDSGIGSP